MSGVRTGGISSSAGSVTTGRDIWAIQERTGLFAGRATEPARVTSGPLGTLRLPVPTRDGRRLLVIGRPTAGREPAVRSVHARFAPYNPEDGPGGSHSRETDSGWPTPSSRRTPCGAAVRRPRRRQLTQPPLRVLLPRWSPDGARIAFMGRTPGQPWRSTPLQRRGRTAADPEGTVPSLIPLGSRREVSDVRPSSDFLADRPCRRPSSARPEDEGPFEVPGQTACSSR